MALCDRRITALARIAVCSERSIRGMRRSWATRLRDLAYRWVRQGRYKLIIPHSVNGKPPWNRYLTKPALYDVVADPDETRNLIGEPNMATTTRNLTAQLDRWWSPP